MTPFLDKVQCFATDCVQTALSFVKILLFTKFRTDVPTQFKYPGELVIMGNGPSLGDLIDNHTSFWQDKTCLMVNFSACSEQFEKVKPEVYVVADPNFWLHTLSIERLYKKMASTVTWQMHLFVPARANSYPLWKSYIKDNKNIIVHFHNTTPVEGFDSITNILYKKGWGVPRPHNVLIPAVMLGLRMPFKRLYMGGAEHSWMSQIIVDEDNVVYMNEEHYYHNKAQRSIAREYSNDRSAKLYEILFHQYVVFKGYFRIRKYAEYLHKEVINITPKSYIDAFDRIKI